MSALHQGATRRQSSSDLKILTAPMPSLLLGASLRQIHRCSEDRSSQIPVAPCPCTFYTRHAPFSFVEGHQSRYRERMPICCCYSWQLRSKGTHWQQHP